LNADLLVTIAIESVDATHFAGRVRRRFARDVGISPSVFGPVSGTVNGERCVRVRQEER